MSGTYSVPDCPTVDSESVTGGVERCAFCSGFSDPAGRVICDSHERVPKCVLRPDAIDDEGNFANGGLSAQQICLSRSFVLRSSLFFQAVSLCVLLVDQGVSCFLSR
jgi:hypothetical protein